MDINEKRFALLIDSDNISAKYITYIMNELNKYGIITFKRIYGDWTSTQATKWKENLLENSLSPIQQFSNTVGKNATDSALIIDAMDILYSNKVEGFCIVSSDSDFTRLASRLREAGMEVIGMGENKTPKSFRVACTVFTNLELLIDEEDEGDSDESNTILVDESDKIIKNKKETVSKKIDRSTIEKAIVDIITENENEGKITMLGQIGNSLVKKYPDFDVRNYGYSLLSKFLEEMSNFELRKENNLIEVSIKENKMRLEEIQNLIKEVVIKSGNEGVGLSEMSNLLHQRYNKFNVKDYGYATFSKFLQSIKGIEIIEIKPLQKRAYYKL
ncbi:NYN domain-containing protein [Clostridium sp. LP20]|uniref:NYN domain-containing protein n=1 Tax=Clostridium sp. LP20 TaxID=3418665 RepID=UPI003EE7F35D